jgi:hypothetical protein
MEKMARRIPIALVAAAITLAGLTFSSAAQTHSVLVQYSFDDGSLDTGPDTFAVYQKAKGSVRLSTQNRYSGYRSIEIQDVAGDKDFPELQGYFQMRSHGKVFARFAVMTTNPAEEFNIALAGPDWFVLRKNGIGFWLKTIDGFLCHYSDSIPKKLFAIHPFVWYVVQVAYDIDAGTYNLLVHREGQERPLLYLQDQPNASKQAGSAVEKFSFIGDAGTDESNVVYYVDDVIVGTDESVTQLPLVAPGRRKLFIDYWNEYQHDVRSRPMPLPVLEFSDLGIDRQKIESLKAAGLWQLDRSRASPERLSVWTERLADTTFMSGDFGSALRRYEESFSIGDDPMKTRILLKLSDVYFRLGDPVKERHYRELLYGRLER